MSSGGTTHDRPQQSGRSDSLGRRGSCVRRPRCQRHSADVLFLGSRGGTCELEPERRHLGKHHYGTAVADDGTLVCTFVCSTVIAVDAEPCSVIKKGHRSAKFQAKGAGQAASLPCLSPGITVNGPVLCYTARNPKQR